MGAGRPIPHKTSLYRLIAFLTRFQFSYIFRTVKDSRFPVMIFTFVGGVIALGTITLAACLTNFPLLFPPLGPSAFILFYVPLSESASPRSVLLSHSMALVVGLLTVRLAGLVFPGAGSEDLHLMRGAGVFVVALAMGMTSLLMVFFRCAHPPAAATALIAAMGFMESPLQMIGLPVALILLVLEAILFNRVIAGLPYPFWSIDPEVAKSYGTLAGIPEMSDSPQRDLTHRIINNRK